MSILDKVMGKRSRNAGNIAAEIASQESAIATCQARIEQSQMARRGAIEDFDDARHKAADEEIATARRDIERREAAIEALKTAHVERVDLEAREALHRDYAAERKAARDLDARIREYVDAANKIASFVREGSAAGYRRDQILKRARTLGEDLEYYGIAAESLDYAVGELPYGDRPGFLHSPRQPK